jgi:hypothetical protein
MEGKKKKKLLGVTLAIDDVFEAWHDESESESESESSGSEDEEGGGGEEGGRKEERKRYCGIISLPFDFAAPDLGAAVARLLRTSLPEASDDSEGFPGGPGAPAAAEENTFGVSAPRATPAAVKASWALRRSSPPSVLLALGRAAGGARRRPPVSRAAAAFSLPLPPTLPSFSAPVRCPHLRRLCVL